MPKAQFLKSQNKKPGNAKILKSSLNINFLFVMHGIYISDKVKVNDNLCDFLMTGGLTDLSGSWTTAIRVGGSFALFSASLLIIETIITRGSRMNAKNTQEKEVEYDNA